MLMLHQPLHLYVSGPFGTNAHGVPPSRLEVSPQSSTSVPPWDPERTIVAVRERLAGNVVGRPVEWVMLALANEPVTAVSWLAVLL